MVAVCFQMFNILMSNAPHYGHARAAHKDACQEATHCLATLIGESQTKRAGVCG